MFKVAYYRFIKEPEIMPRHIDHIMTLAGNRLGSHDYKVFKAPGKPANDMADYIIIFPDEDTARNGVEFWTSLAKTGIPALVIAGYGNESMRESCEDVIGHYGINGAVLSELPTNLYITIPTFIKVCRSSMRRGRPGTPIKRRAFIDEARGKRYVITLENDEVTDVREFVLK